MTAPDTAWYLPPASDTLRQGFVRVLNHSDAAGEASIAATDDAGTTYEPLTLALGPRAATHFHTGDLESGNPAKGLTGATGMGAGGWRLAIESETLDVEALAYVRADDGFLAGLNDVAPREDGALRIATFNPGSNVDQVSHLRLVNPGDEEAEATVTGVDDAGLSPGSPVVLTLPAGTACMVDAAQLESGTGLACGSPQDGLGDGAGKWRLAVESDEAPRGDEPAVEPGRPPVEPVRQGVAGLGEPVARAPVPGGVRPARAAGRRARGQPRGPPHGHGPGLRRLRHALRRAAAVARRGGDGALRLRRPGARQPGEGPVGTHRGRRGHVAADAVRPRRGARLRARGGRLPGGHERDRAAGALGAPGGVLQSRHQPPHERAAAGEPLLARGGGGRSTAPTTWGCVPARRCGCWCPRRTRWS